MATQHYTVEGAEITPRARTLTSLIVSNALPVVSRITEAAPEAPYVALVFPLDLDLLRGLAVSVPTARGMHSQAPFSITLCPTDPAMQDALTRYFDQCAGEETRQILAPITRQEIHARLLLGPHAGALQKLLWHETTASRIFQATREIQSDLSLTVVVGELADRVGMSQSAFFEHFKAVTGTSPLQYQKDLRLLHARDTLRSSDAKVSEVAFGVGYESAAQFSREYARKFGLSPRRDRGELAAG